MGFAAKRRKLFKNEGPTEEEIKFDNAARAEFLTGFHKRKVQRAKHAQEAAEKRLKEEKREQRKRLREERQAELRRAFEVHQARMREINGPAPGSNSDDDADENEEADGEEAGSNDEWNGVTEPEPVDHTAEYIDEDKYTTVTVEEIDPRNGFGSNSESDEDDEEERDTENGDKKKTDHKEEENKDTEKKKKKRVWSKDAPDKPKKPKKKRNFKYETKDERRVSRFKERTGNRKRAKERKAK